MAYAASGLTLISNAGGQSIYHYRSADPINTIMGAAYFATPAAALMFNLGDLMVVRSSYGGAEEGFLLRCTNITTPTFSLQMHGPAVLSRAVPLSVTATANTDFSVILPACSILRITTRTTTAFTAAADAQLSVGTSAAGGVELVAAVSIKAAGVVAHTVVAAAAGFAGGTVYLRIVQTGSTTTVGAAVCAIEYA